MQSWIRLVTPTEVASPTSRRRAELLAGSFFLEIPFGCTERELGVIMPVKDVGEGLLRIAVM
jgi:hypothetical protein